MIEIFSITISEPVESEPARRAKNETKNSAMSNYRNQDKCNRGRFLSSFKRLQRNLLLLLIEKFIIKVLTCAEDVY